MNNLNSRGVSLVQHLHTCNRHDAARTHARSRAEKVNVVGAGKMVTAAYEQLRNAADNTEDHLLLQNAIRRFYKQLFITRDEDLIKKSGNELAIELTLAGYIANNTLLQSEVAEISRLARKYYAAYEHMQSDRSVALDEATQWTLDVLAVEVESIINDHTRDTYFTEFSYQQYLHILDKTVLFDGGVPADYDQALFVAVHLALMKSDEAVIRTQLLRRYRADIDQYEHYIELNKSLTKLFSSDTVDVLRRAVSRHGAPLRILRRMIDDRDDMAELLQKREVFLDEYEKQITAEYQRVGDRINRAIVRSVIFLIITKVLIGLAIEIPYDYWAHGEIIILPLIINLFFPPVYMVLLRFTHVLPGYSNTEALVERMEAMLYSEQKVLSVSQQRSKRYNPVFSIMYTIAGLTVFSVVIAGLLLLEFSIVHILIFMVFLSAASFLGFRLSRLIRELEIVRTSSNGLTFVRDLIYLPFVVVGQWISDKYNRVNIITIILDMLIELPLKTVLRIVRQWSAFIDDRKDGI